MVRRERLMRRMAQSGGTVRGLTPASRIGRMAASAGAARVRTGRGLSVPSSRIPVQISPEQEARTASMQLNTLPSARRETTVEEIPDDVRAQGASARRAWLRERVARRQARDYEERANVAQVAEASRPFWRRVGGRLFPSL